MDESQVNFSSVRKVGKRPAFRSVSFREGAVIFNEGDHSRDTYFVVSGTLTSFKKVANRVIPISTYKDGDSFGELATLGEKDRPFSVRAETDCQLLVIPPLLLVAQLQQAPRWASIAFEHFSHDIQERFELLNRNTVKEPMEALTLYLSDKCMKVKNDKNEHIQVSFFDVQDELALISRLSSEQVRKQVGRLANLGLITIDAKQQISISDPELLEMLYVVLNHTRNGKPMSSLMGDSIMQTCLSTMPRLPGKNSVPKSTLLDLWNASIRSGDVQQAFEQLVRLGAIQDEQNQMVRINRSRCDWLFKAQREIPILLEKLKGQK